MPVVLIRLAEGASSIGRFTQPDPFKSETIYSTVEKVTLLIPAGRCAIARAYAQLGASGLAEGGYELIDTIIVEPLVVADAATALALGALGTVFLGAAALIAGMSLYQLTQTC